MVSGINTKPLISARIEQSELDLIKGISKDRGEDVSDFLRRCIRMELGRLNYLSDSAMQALGLSVVKDHKAAGA